MVNRGGKILPAVYPLLPATSFAKHYPQHSIRPCRERLQELWCNKYPDNRVAAYLFKYVVYLLSVAPIRHCMLLTVLLFRQQTIREMALTHSIQSTLLKLNQLTY